MNLINTIIGNIKKQILLSKSITNSHNNWPFRIIFNYISIKL